MIRKVVLFGNSGSGKSTLAKKMMKDFGLAHLDLDTLAWKEGPSERRELELSKIGINRFLGEYESWVIEGCYADLLQIVALSATKLIFLNPEIEVCVKNCRSRPWEQHKYNSFEEQNENLSMLIDWVRQYEMRGDEFSFSSHQALYDNFDGEKVKYSLLEQYC